jgi:Dolichyl-phosphate-mannose-protein mannosyltransferase
LGKASTKRASLGPVLTLFLPVLAIYVLCLNGVWATDHTSSFLQLDWSLYIRHTVSLGSASNFTANFAGSGPSVDDFVYKGYYYSALAPGTPFMALPLTAIGFFLDGHYTDFGNALVLSELFVAITNAVAVYLVFRISRFFFSTQTSLFLAFAYAFSTISWPFATFFFQSDPSSMFDLLAVFYALRITRSEKPGYLDWIFCGTSIAAGLTVDYINAIMIPLIGGYLLIYEFKIATRLARFEILSKTVVYLCAALEGIVLIAAYNRAAFGNFFTSSEQIYLHSSTFFGNFTYPLYLGIVLNLITPFRGLFFYCPILILGIPGFYIMLRNDSQRADGLFLLAAFLALLLPYSAWYAPGGGLSYGPRFIIPSIPFLLVPAGFLIESVKRSFKILAYFLYVIGVATNGIAALTSALGPAAGPWLSSPFLDSALSSFIQGFHSSPNIDSWWKSSAEPWWFPVSVAIITVAALLPFVSERLDSRSLRENKIQA